MQEQEYDSELQNQDTAVHEKLNHVVIWNLAKEFHVSRNTVANIAKELSIQFKYENCSGRIRAYVYGDEGERIRQVLDQRYNDHLDQDEL